MELEIDQMWPGKSKITTRYSHFHENLNHVVLSTDTKTYNSNDIILEMNEEEKKKQKKYV